MLHDRTSGLRFGRKQDGCGKGCAKKKEEGNDWQKVQGGFVGFAQCLKDTGIDPGSKTHKPLGHSDCSSSSPRTTADECQLKDTSDNQGAAEAYKDSQHKEYGHHVNKDDKLASDGPVSERRGSPTNSAEHERKAGAHFVDNNPWYPSKEPSNKESSAEGIQLNLRELERLFESVAVDSKGVNRASSCHRG